LPFTLNNDLEVLKHKTYHFWPGWFVCR